ncbi:MAG: lipoprotein [Prevotella sp.]|nr:lipoprotein [Prevotella sp.]
MKRILIIAIAALALTGCQEKKNAAAVSQTDVRIDSLQRIIDQKDNELNDVISTFNEIQEGFRLIELAEKNVSIIKDGEATNKPEQIRESIRSIQQRMQHNRELIARLQQQVREGSSRSEELRRTINNFVKELEAKNNELQQLRTELQEKDIRIAELDNTVSTLNSDVTQLREETAKKTETINNQDVQLNSAWYVFGTKKELQEQNIYQKGKVLQSNFNKNYFTKIDIRVDKEIKLYSKSARMLTSHPAGSYTLQPDAQQQYVLRITNPQQFWSTSKYLVVLVK